MNFFAICLCFVASTVGVSSEENDINEIRSVEENCQKQTGVSVEKVNNFELVDDPLVKENALCILKAYGIMDEDGNIYEDKLKEQITSELGEKNAEQVAKKCTIKKESPQETAHESLWCVGEQKPIPGASPDEKN
ncbi:odorant binding protein C18 [Tribolium castaneum]|uniref:Odorant binding protein C18 n=1 Tax=Tribolium castaneum TaxID=7070 RepID=D6WAD0_TRICA|nr:PREDICTED: B2 protein [Tribolium castaneum]EEZ99197.1 odorant binding protein C18 [Tribolium castaneum]|eukprot:XP_001812978.1 PREDICTED: B2 protein [Tribolium castaneum]